MGSDLCSDRAWSVRQSIVEPLSVELAAAGMADVGLAVRGRRYQGE